MNSQSSQEAAPLEQSHLTFPGAPADGNRLWQMAAVLFALISFLEISRVLDPVHVHAIAVLVVLLAVALLLSRRALVFWKCGAGRALPCFVAWVVLTYVLAPHTELSTPYVLSCVEGAVFFLAGVGLLTSVADFRTFFRMLAVAGLVVCALGIVWGGTMNGRHALRAGPYVDPNSYAMALLALAPILWIALPEKPVWMRFGGALAAMVPVLVSLRAISRGAFVAMHGSWNRSKRTGYKVVRLILKDGVPTGEYEDFLTGFVYDAASVSGRPVGVAEAGDGSLLVSDDAAGLLWRVRYVGDAKDK